MHELPIATGLDRSGVAQFATGNSYVEFFTGTEVDPVASKEAGRPVSRNVDKVKVLHPGERDCAVLVATEMHKRRWPTQWAAYQNGKEQIPEGTQIDALFPGDPAIVDNLKRLRFFTVEQLANASDTALQQIGMGCREWQAKAKKFLAASAGSAGFHKLESELEAKETRIKQLEDVVSRLEEKLRRLDSEDETGSDIAADYLAQRRPEHLVKRRPGRPRKVEA